jgi:putative restriction endonuclease
MERQIPVIYFLGTSPGRYQPIIPTFILGWHPDRLRVDLAFGVIVGASAQATLPASPERRYALREIKARLRRKPRICFANIETLARIYGSVETVTQPS